MDKETKDKCLCEKAEPSESDSSTSDSSTPTKDKKSKISIFNLRKAGVHFPSKRSKNKLSQSNGSTSNSTNSISKKSPKWSFKINCTKKEPKVAFTTQANQNCCKCTCYRRTESADNVSTTSTSPEQQNHEKSSSARSIVEAASTSTASTSTDLNIECRLEDDAVDSNKEMTINEPQVTQEERINESSGRTIYDTASSTQNIVVDMHWMRTIHEDCDEAARLARAREIEQGVDPPANFRPVRRVQLLCPENVESSDCCGCGDGGGGGQPQPQPAPQRLQLVCPKDLNVDTLRALFQSNITLLTLRPCPADYSITGCHTQVDFIHCLVPDLLNITNCSFYWGKIDRYEAERLLDAKPEGTFLLRDSAQEEFLFSVSFRKYGRTLHARIEQWNHKFSFDSHDPGVFTSDTVCGLIEHYKDTANCMFFEPMLTSPLNRNFTFSLQHLTRATIVSRLTYDNINQLQLPKSLKSYLKEYHYRQKVRVERFEDEIQLLELRNFPL